MTCSRCGRAKANSTSGFCSPCEVHHKTALELQKKYAPDRSGR